jgi:type III restriction enzyme
MLTSTDDADDVADWLQRKYPRELGGDRTLVIHTNASGDVTKNDLEQARRLARDVDAETSNVGAIVSVMMLREGWDVQNVTVVVGLRPFTASPTFR